MTKKVISSVISGIYVSLGALTYLIIPNKMVGTMFFALGILLVLNFNKRLVTRVTPLSTISDEYNWVDILIALGGNILGSIFTGLIVSFTRMVPKIQESIIELGNVKMNDSSISLLIMGILCGIFVGYAVLLSKKYERGSFAQIFYVWLFVTAFVFCGFDHIVANAFYFSAYGFISSFSVAMIMPMIVVTIGNIIGGLLVGLIEKNNMKEE